MTDCHFPYFLWPWQFWEGILHCPSTGMCLMFFLRLTGTIASWKEGLRSKVLFSLHSIKGTYHKHDWTDDITLISYPGCICQVSLLWNYSFLLLSIQYSLEKKVSVLSLHVSSGELCSSSLRVDKLPKLFGIILHIQFVYYPRFIYSFSHLFIAAWIHGYLFYT